MTYVRIPKASRKKIEGRLQTIFKLYGKDAETVANRMIQQRRTERRNRREITKLQQEIAELKGR